jgi:hypothetical protein
MYMNLAISLVTDLGLDRDIPNPDVFSDFDLTGLYSEGKYTIPAKQAYLGTYYLSSGYLPSSLSSVSLSLSLYAPISSQVSRSITNKP